MSFNNLGLAPEILSALKKIGFLNPTPVQERAIPLALAGHDLMVSSQTGSGKTAAFMIPSLDRLTKRAQKEKLGTQILVLTPTRELALQITQATTSYGAGLAQLRIATIVGGVPYNAQLRTLSKRVDIIIATPGRLLDHLKSKRLRLNTIHTLVLDEADRMLDMGFIDDIEAIVSNLPATRQTLLFSATLYGGVDRLATNMLNNPKRVEISGLKEKHANITQSLLYADDFSHKLALLHHILLDNNLNQAIVFTSTKRSADDLAEHLSEKKFSVSALHGDMNQRQRSRTLSSLKKGHLRILVATDLAARGIDVCGISHAINFDLPMQVEDYIHRIGRTGRAGKNGLAFTIAMYTEHHKIRRIESFTGQEIKRQTIIGLEPKRLPQLIMAKARRPSKFYEKRPSPGNTSRYGNRNRSSIPGSYKNKNTQYRTSSSQPALGSRHEIYAVQNKSPIDLSATVQKKQGSHRRTSYSNPRNVRVSATSKLSERRRNVILHKKPY